MTPKAGIASLAACHTLRYSLATHLLEPGYDIRTIQELLDNRDVSTTMIFTHVLNRGGLGPPLEFEVHWIDEAQTSARYRSRECYYLGLDTRIDSPI